jgi:hypothetical protein
MGCETLPSVAMLALATIPQLADSHLAFGCLFMHGTDRRGSKQVNPHVRYGMAGGLDFSQDESIRCH